MYHLRQLQRDKLVTKMEDGSYTLSSAGKLEADRRQLEDSSLGVYEQPRLVLLLVIYDEHRGWLLHTRSIQPVIRMTGFLHGNIELGQPLTETARLRLKALAGLDGRFTYRGSATITIYQHNDLESYVHALIMYCRNPAGELIHETPVGTNVWDPDPDFAAAGMLPSTGELIRLIGQEPLFYTELTYHL